MLRSRTVIQISATILLPIVCVFSFIQPSYAILSKEKSALIGGLALKAIDCVKNNLGAKYNRELIDAIKSAVNNCKVEVESLNTVYDKEVGKGAGLFYFYEIFTRDVANVVVEHIRLSQRMPTTEPTIKDAIAALKNEAPTRANEKTDDTKNREIMEKELGRNHPFLKLLDIGKKYNTPRELLVKTYSDYIYIKKCFTARESYAEVYVSELEVDKSKQSAKTIESILKGRDQTIDLNKAWSEANEVSEDINAFKLYSDSEEYFDMMRNKCQAAVDYLERTSTALDPLQTQVKKDF